jgi:hypothetical protein
LYTLDYFHDMTGAEIRTILLDEGVAGIMRHQMKLEEKNKESQNVEV